MNRREIYRTARTGWHRVRRATRLTRANCRECGELVRSLEEVCPCCGAHSPVRLPVWITGVLLVLTVHQLVSLVL